MVLPSAPKTVVTRSSADTKEYTYPGYHHASLLISYGLNSRHMTIEGVIHDSSVANLISNYITPLKDCVDSICHIDGAGNRYHQDYHGTALNWICTSFEFTYEGGFRFMAKYKMEFTLGIDSSSAYGGIIIA